MNGNVAGLADRPTGAKVGLELPHEAASLHEGVRTTLDGLANGTA